eukprot:TRINITY_DN5108_c0_g1_i1.p1 TRINITY_DN5108_c0_g1~~TRINITY_DN5108_c0_g1_i1.p1  ORF type:complete len:874 (-),score=87.48 TRINITY_DN5108_c0_g1_i1:150-2771(-)
MVEPFHIRFESLELVVGEKKILEGVSGSFAPGKLTAIMGSSGCGKSSMMSVLSGRANYGKTSGSVFVNGKEQKISKFQRVVGFVPQEDIMIRIATVEEILLHSAETRLPSEFTSVERECVVEEVIRILGLENIRHSIIGDEDERGISGGQRKRVNIAIELVSNPSVLFLDEPTSGLDSFSSIEVCDVLKKLAHQKGLTIVAVIHQPRYEIFEMFDDVAILGVGGRPVYLGPTEKVADWFECIGYSCPPRINPADYFIDVISGNYDNKLKPSTNNKSDGSILPMSLKLPNKKNNPTTCQYLQSIWELNGNEYHRQVSKNSNPILDLGDFLPSTSQKEDKNGDEASLEEDEGEEEQFNKKTDDNNDPNTIKSTSRDDKIIGTYQDFFNMFFMCLLLPHFLSLFFAKWWKVKTLRAKFGAIFGATIWLVVLIITLAILAEKNDVNISFMSIPITIILYQSLAFMVIIFAIDCFLYYRYIYLRKLKRPQFMLCFLLGIVAGPFALLVGINEGRKTSSALFAGFAVTIQYAGVALLCAGFGKVIWYLLAGIAVELLVLSKLVIFVYRFITLPEDERQTKQFWIQVLLFAKREIVLQSRRIKEIVFHLSQLCIGGLFLGFIFFNRQYKGPLFKSWYQFSQSDGQLCPQEVSEFVFLTPICEFLQMPQDDPLTAMASLSLLTVSLCSVSYSINTFGREKTVFQRESQVGISSGAYYLGKSLANLPIAAVAPIIYLLSFGGLAILKSSFYLHYLQLLVCYINFAGVGYLISLTVPVGIAQLAGVFFVLTSMMFSGANPTLNQLQNNELLGKALYYPTFLSYNRWGIELFYLVEIQEYTSTYTTMKVLYDYDISDFFVCWSVIAFMAFVYRVFAYVILVLRE